MLDEVTRQELYLTGPGNPAITHRWYVTGRFPGRLGGLWCCIVCTDGEGVIIWTADMLRVFIGQDIFNLIQWGRAEIEEL